MTKFVVNQLDITRQVLELLNPGYTWTELDTAHKKWWLNKRPGGGLGLTYHGQEAFASAGLQSWTIEVQPVDIHSAKNVLRLDHYFPCPYYLERKRTKKYTMYVYDSRIYVALQLYGGLKEYLDNLSTKRGDY